MASLRSYRSGVVVLALILAGCESPVDGQATPVPVDSMEGSLPSAAELQTVLGIALQADGPSKVGAAELLRDDAESYGTAECAPVTHPLLKGTYHDVEPGRVAFGIWKTDAKPAGRVRVGIAEMASPAVAGSFFAESVAVWARCEGRTVTHFDPDTVTFVDHITDVSEADEVVSAALMITDDIGVMTPTPHHRALGVVSRYVVDVDVFGEGWPAGAAAPMHDAEAVARLTIKKLGANG